MIRLKSTMTGMESDAQLFDFSGTGGPLGGRYEPTCVRPDFAVEGMEEGHERFTLLGGEVEGNEFVGVQLVQGWISIMLDDLA